MAALRSGGTGGFLAGEDLRDVLRGFVHGFAQPSVVDPEAHALQGVADPEDHRGGNLAAHQRPEQGRAVRDSCVAELERGLITIRWGPARVGPPGAWRPRAR
ncbi:MAG: hypothetical protein R2716_02755 [Microthrixaceae bacterium]